MPTMPLGRRKRADEVAEHIEHDPLVHWGWKPGPGREPAPYSITQLVEYLKQWEAADAPCPTAR